MEKVITHFAKVNDLVIPEDGIIKIIVSDIGEIFLEKGVITWDDIRTTFKYYQSSEFYN